MYVCICILTHGYMHMCIYINKHIFIYIMFVCMYVYMDLLMQHTLVYICKCVCPFVYYVL